MNRMKSLREEKGLTMKDVANCVGLPYTTYVNYEKGAREPSSETLIKIAKFFDASVDYLIGRTDEIDLPSNIIPMPTMRKIPLVGNIACGSPILAEENIECEVNIPDNIRADFALRCKGRSMEGANIFDGDIVYIRKQDMVDNGQIAAVLIEDMEAEATLKRVYYNPEEGELRLVPENPNEWTKVFRGEELNSIRILGLAVGLTRSLEDK